MKLLDSIKYGVMKTQSGDTRIKMQFLLVYGSMTDGVWMGNTFK